ncbi:hypothetical protein R6Q57_008345, partial [Mikania cordata]
MGIGLGFLWVVSLQNPRNGDQEEGTSSYIKNLLKMVKNRYQFKLMRLKPCLGSLDRTNRTS